MLRLHRVIGVRTALLRAVVTRLRCERWPVSFERYYEAALCLWDPGSVAVEHLGDIGLSGALSNRGGESTAFALKQTPRRGVGLNYLQFASKHDAQIRERAPLFEAHRRYFSKMQYSQFQAFLRKRIAHRPFSYSNIFGTIV